MSDTYQSGLPTGHNSPPSAKTPAKIGNSATVGTRPVMKMSGTENRGASTKINRASKQGK